MVVQWYTEAYDALDPTGNITIKWDVISWTPDGYIVSDHHYFHNGRKYLGKHHIVSFGI